MAVVCAGPIEFESAAVVAPTAAPAVEVRTEKAGVWTTAEGSTKWVALATATVVGSEWTTLMKPSTRSSVRVTVAVADVPVDWRVSGETVAERTREESLEWTVRVKSEESGAVGGGWAVSPNERVRVRESTAKVAEGDTGERQTVPTSRFGRVQVGTVGGVTVVGGGVAGVKHWVPCRVKGRVQLVQTIVPEHVVHEGSQGEQVGLDRK